MVIINGIVTDPIDAVQRDSVRAVAAIQRHVALLRAQVAVWTPQPMPAYFVQSYRRSLRR